LLTIGDAARQAISPTTDLARLRQQALQDGLRPLRLAGATSDNVTCLALAWETPDNFESTRGSITTDSILDGVFASTVQAGWPDTASDDLDDEAIERSIAEINEAIRRSALKKA